MRGYSTIELPDKIDTIKLDNLPEFDIEDYNLSDPKEVNRYFKSIERICRNSRSYKKFIDFLREQVDMNKCSFYENVNNIDTYSIKIHIHHAPLTLYDIVTTVYAKRLCNQEPLSELMVAKEVMWVHYNMMVGLIPLSETVHELVHKGLLFIPLNTVFGLYKNFINLYGSYMDPNLKSTIEEAERYIDPSGAYEFPNTSELVEALSTKINAIDKGLVDKQFNIKDKDSFLDKVK